MSDSTLQAVIDKFGVEAQTRKVIEELTELSLSLQHGKDGKASIEDVANEIVDVEIMIEQLYLMYPELTVLTERERSLKMKYIESLVWEPGRVEERPFGLSHSARSLLRELVELKLEKEAHGKTRHYREQQPKVWVRAIKFVRDKDGGLSV